VIALATYEPRIKAKADLLISQINANLGKPLDVTAWSMFLNFDIMGDVGFGKDFNNLRTGIKHPAIKGIHDSIAVVGVLSHIPWLLNIVGRIPFATAGYSPFLRWCADKMKHKQKVSKHLVLWSYLICWTGDHSVNSSPLCRHGILKSIPKTLYPGC